MALVDFAPLRIPLHRRLETAAVALYYYSFFFGALIGTLIILGLFFTSYYPIAIFYLTWAYLIDGKTPEHGGRRSNFMRKLRIWKYFRDYFPITLIKTAELDPSKNYVFGYHPHGILCAGAFCNFATEATDFSSVFPGITPHLLPLMGKTMSIIIVWSFNVQWTMPFLSRLFVHAFLTDIYIHIQGPNNSWICNHVSKFLSLYKDEGMEYKEPKRKWTWPGVSRMKHELGTRDL